MNACLCFVHNLTSAATFIHILKKGSCMKKLCLAAMVATVLVGCNAGDEVVEHGGIDINNMSQADLQGYADVTADAVTVVARAAQDCATGLAVGKTLQCDIPEIQGNIDIAVAKGSVKVERQQNEIIIHTPTAMQFTTHNAITNGEVITLSFNSTTDDDYIMTMNDYGQIMFKGMLINTAESNAKYWSTEAKAPFTYKYDANTVHPYLTKGNGIITGKDNQNFNWYADDEGHISVAR